MAKKTNYDNGFKFKVALAAIKGDKTYEVVLLSLAFLNQPLVNGVMN